MAAPMESGRQSGVRTNQGAGLVDGVHTNVICTDFSNKLFIIVTQLEKLGTLVEASRDAIDVDHAGTPTFTTKVLLGKDEPLTHVMARSIVSKIPVQKPILLAVALKNTEPRTLRAVEDLVLQNRTW